MAGCGNADKWEEAKDSGWNFFQVPSIRLSGGIMVLWKSDLATFRVFESSSQFIIGEIDVQNKVSWRIATIYGSTDVYKRRKLWEKLQLYSTKDKVLIIGGDLNCLPNKDDKRGGKIFVYSLGTKEMDYFLVSNDLHEVMGTGPKYTWCNNKTGADKILERLDRCYLNSVVLSSPHRLVVRKLARVSSDHCPIILNMLNYNVALKKTIKCEDVWISNPASIAVVKKAWSRKSMGDFSQILNYKL
ncbi:uncharacterized protein LOC110100762 [Dendrobium catenatum]|uniref:uncharacterized protein LOC110100762 n=1 Tax=Dendrobium catenatum TaxID=906689 RepID=UPI0009F6459E|nr:uncharacterized protein LOC110100762 [Dendrobium catenatum]